MLTYQDFADLMDLILKRERGSRLSQRTGKTIHRWKKYTLLCALGPFVLLQQPALSGAEELDLTGLTIEELMGLQVTSVSKKKQSLSDSAAAIFVITSDDLYKF